MNLDDISLINVSRCKYKDATHVLKHCHNFYHLLYVTGGNGSMYVDNQRYIAREDDIYLMAPGMEHEFISASDHPLCTIEVKFAENDTHLKDLLNKLPCRMETRDKTLKLFLESLLQEVRHKRLFYKQLITLNFAQFLFYLIRMNNPDTCDEPEWSSHGQPYSAANLSDEPNDAILEYIHANYQKRLTLRDLCKRFTVNQAQLCKIFNARYGVSPIQYVNNYRIKKVKELLAYSNLTITEISEQAGFQSVHYLSRYFSSKEGISPLQFRQRLDESVYFIVEERLKVVSGFLIGR